MSNHEQTVFDRLSELRHGLLRLHKVLLDGQLIEATWTCRWIGDRTRYWDPNGEEIRFWEWQREAFPRAIKTFFSQGDLERRAATGQVRRDPLTVAIDKHIDGQDAHGSRLHQAPVRGERDHARSVSR